METPRTNKNAGYYCGHGIKKNSDLVIDPNGPFVLADFARELERENARLREALEMAEKELVHLFTVLPIGGVLPSPSVMQHVQWARLANNEGSREAR